MSEAVNLIINQQRIVRQFLTENFGSRIAEVDKKERQWHMIMCHIKNTHTTLEIKEVIIWHSNLKDMIMHNIQNWALIV